MKKDNLKNLFQELEGQFDIELPEEGHELRFLYKLKQQHNVTAHKPKKVHFWKPLLAVAASIVLCFSIFTIVPQQEPKTMDLASVSPELERTQSFFTLAISEELKALEAERSPETEEMINDAMKELHILENKYEDLKVDLTESGNDKRVIYAMIANFQNRINVLKTVLDHIENVKNFKNNQNENTTTI